MWKRKLRRKKVCAEVRDVEVAVGVRGLAV